MQNILNKGYAIEIHYKDGDVHTKYFGIKELQKATNFFNKMNKLLSLLRILIKEKQQLLLVYNLQMNEKKSQMRTHL